MNYLKRNPRKKSLYFIFFILLISLGLIYKLITDPQENPRLTVENPFISASNLFTPKSPPKSTLGETVEVSFEQPITDYAVFIKNLYTQETYSFNPDRPFTSGSLYKLWVAATAYQQIEKGFLKKEEVLTQDVSFLNRIFNIDPEYAEKTEGTISLSVAQALDEMITVSDNYAALLLSQKIKLSNVALFLKQNGFTESKIGTTTTEPVTTASETALFLEKLTDGKLINKENTQEMLELLKQQQLNGKIPKYLPEKTVIAHKTGELGEFSHDAGIVYLPENTYIIVVLSKTDSRPKADEQIAVTSNAVYNYFIEK